MLPLVLLSSRHSHGRAKPVTQLLSLKLGSLQPQPMLTRSFLPWRGEKSSLELGQHIKIFCHTINFAFLNLCAVLMKQKTGIVLLKDSIPDSKKF